jgi:hypothetical protein
VASRGQAPWCRLYDGQPALLAAALDAKPLAAGWTDQRWVLLRVYAKCISGQQDEANRRIDEAARAPEDQ